MATKQTEQNLDAEGMSREVGLLGLLWASEGSIIGSGWLFGALTAASIAGPSAIIAWCIASVIVIILALVHAELGGLFPVTGGTSRFPHYAFGSLAGATFGWFAYIQAASVAPIEVLAAIQYMSSASWASGFLKANGTLSGSGILVAVLLMFVFVIVNLIGVRWLARVNNALTTWKVLIPVLAIVVFLLFHFHSGNFSGGGGFFVKGAEFKDILIAIPNGGIVFSLLGFEQAVQLGGESANPKRDLPRAVIGSILLGAAVYILVQVAFIGALSPHVLSEGKTWAGLATPGTNPLLKELNAAPFYSVAKVAALGWLAVILRIDAVISPGGTGLIYLTSASRISFGLSKNGYIPEAFERNSERTKVPVFGITITAIIGLLFLLPFPSWSKLVGVVTSASVLMYAGAPLALGALRLQKPELERAYRLPLGGVLAPLSFVLANFIVYWAGWGTYSTLMVVMILGFLLMAASAVFKLNPNQPEVDWGAAMWVFPYLVGMGVISYLGGFGGSGIIGGVGVFKTVLVGGGAKVLTTHPIVNHKLTTLHTIVSSSPHLPLYWDLLVLAVFSLGIYYLAIAKRLPAAKVDHYVAEVYPPPLGE
jgi:amino acid transporter